MATYEGVADDNAYSTGYYVYKLAADGTVLSDTLVGITGSGLGDDYKANNFLSVAVDKDGSIYVAKRQFDYDFDQTSGTHRNLVGKFSASGALLWQRPSTVGTPKGVTVSPSGSVYVVGSKGIARSPTAAT